jgi:hypothetical protein
MSQSRVPFNDPIPLPCGRQIVTLKTPQPSQIHPKAMPVILTTPEDVRHPARVHRHAVRELLVKPQQPLRERDGAEIREPEIGCNDGGDARRVAGDASRSMMSSTSDMRPSP